MTTLHKSRSIIALAIPALIFIACSLISFSNTFKVHPEGLSVAILLDLLLVAPLAYYLLIRKTTISKFTVLRVLMLGIVVAGLILSKENTVALQLIKKWLAPLVETILVCFLFWKFYIAKKKASSNHESSTDFLQHCRAILTSVLGNEKMANVLASEVAVFYYIFSKRQKTGEGIWQFSTYKENDIVLVLYTFLCLFVIETVGMHFIFLLWNKTAAWIFTGLGLYSCLQLFAHTRSLQKRPTLILEDSVMIRHGLMGADALIKLNNIEKIIATNKDVPGADTIKIAFIKGLEKHNLAIYLKEPVEVIKAFGIRKKASIILVSIDNHPAFVTQLNNSIQNLTG